MSFSFTLATISLEVRSDVHHVAIFVHVLEALIIVINFFSLHGSLRRIDSQGLSQVRREDYLYRVDLRGLSTLDLIYS